MEKLMDILRSLFKALLARPEAPKRPACRHCGGGRCYGACQMDAERAPASRKGPEA